MANILIIETHFDDAALSIGGMIAGRSRANKICVLTTHSVSTSANPPHLIADRFFDSEKVSRVRLAESVAACGFLGVGHLELGEPETPVRIARGGPRFPVAGELSALSEKIFETAARTGADEIWFPMAVGRHPDHIVVRNACLLMAARNPSLAASGVLALYEDLPYAQRSPGSAEGIHRAIEAQGGKLQRCGWDISSDELEMKLRAVSLYRSQIIRGNVEAEIRRAALFGGLPRQRLAEVYYVLRNPPALGCRSALSEFEGDWRLLSKTVRLLRRFQRGRCFSVISPFEIYGVGQVAALVQGAVPGAKAEIIAPATAAGAPQEPAADAVNIRAFPVGSRMRRARAMLPQILHFGRPTVVVLSQRWCVERPWMAGLLRLLFPLRPLAVYPDMESAYSALADACGVPL